MTTPNRPRRRGWAFLVPTAALLVTGSLDWGKHLVGADLMTIGLVGVAAGVAWQLLYRRDLTDRLTYFAAYFAVMATVVFGIAWSDRLSSSPAPFGILVGGVLTGLVYSEQWLRGRDERARKRLERASTVARP